MGETAMSTKTCENCGREVEEFVKFCPDCGNSTFSNSDSMSSASNINSSDSVNPIIAKLFYWNENGQYYFSKTKFFSILIFLDIFIARIYYTSEIFPGLVIAAIVAIVAFLIGRSIHGKNSAHVPSRGSLTEDIVSMLFYWEESVISKTKILIIAIYFLLIIIYCIKVGWDMFFAATLIFLVIAIPAYFIGKSLHND